MVVPNRSTIATNQSRVFNKCVLKAVTLATSTVLGARTTPVADVVLTDVVALIHAGLNVAFTLYGGSDRDRAG